MIISYNSIKFYIPLYINPFILYFHTSLNFYHKFHPPLKPFTHRHLDIPIYSIAKLPANRRSLLLFSLSPFAEWILVRDAHLRGNDVSEHSLGPQPRVQLLEGAVPEGINTFAIVSSFFFCTLRAKTLTTQCRNE